MLFRSFQARRTRAAPGRNPYSPAGMGGLWLSQKSIRVCAFAPRRRRCHVGTSTSRSGPQQRWNDDRRACPKSADTSCAAAATRREGPHEPGPRAPHRPLPAGHPVCAAALTAGPKAYARCRGCSSFGLTAPKLPDLPARAPAGPVHDRASGGRSAARTSAGHAGRAPDARGSLG